MEHQISVSASPEEEDALDRAASLLDALSGALEEHRTQGTPLTLCAQRRGLDPGRVRTLLGRKGFLACTPGDTRSLAEAVPPRWTAMRPSAGRCFPTRTAIMA